MFFCQASWRSLYQQAAWTALSQLPFDTQKIRKMMWQMAFDEIYWLCQDTKAVIEGLIMFSRWDQTIISPQKHWVPGWSKFARFRLAHPTCLEGHSLKTIFFNFHHGRWGFRCSLCFLRKPSYIIWQIPASSSIMRCISVFFVFVLWILMPQGQTNDMKPQFFLTM